MQQRDGDLSDSFNNVSLNSDERKPPQSQNKNRRRGINSHLYTKTGGRGRGGGRGGDRGGDRGGGRGANRTQNNTTEDRQNHNQPTTNESYSNKAFHFNSNSDAYNATPPKTLDNPSMIEDGKPGKKKNTETFKPSHKPSDMRIVPVFVKTEKYPKEVTSRDVVAVHGLYCEESDLTIYNKLLDETKTKNSGVNFNELWQLWHGDTHLIADDKKRWKDTCPTFKMVLKKIENYFDMDIKATRLNWYRDSSEWKPFHHDAAAINPEKAKVQNFTVAVSFGAERTAAFEHASTRTVISMPQPNGSIYTFGKDINVLWRHGILQVPPDQYYDEGRISIIAWGAVKQTQL